MIPVNEPILQAGNEKKYLAECIDTNFVSSEGPFVKKFEKAFSDYLNQSHGIAVCNGTAAIETALYAIGINKGDEIIMPSFNIISSAIAAIRLGAVPVLVDIDSDDWNMDVNEIESKITPRTKAILTVDIYGSPVDYDKIIEIAKKNNLIIIEDFAEAQGAEYFSKKQNKWLKCGSIGDISATSFYANKIITTGEGGMIFTNNDLYAERARSYRNLCFINGNRFYHEELGYNFRMSNLQAAVGLAQFEQIQNFISIKIKNGELYRDRFNNIKGIKFHPVKKYSKCVYWMYSLELSPELGITADEMMSRLKKKNIDTRPFFKGLHIQPVLQALGYFLKEQYPKTDKASKYGFYIPSGLTLTEQQIDTVVKTIINTLHA